MRIQSAIFLSLTTLCALAACGQDTEHLHASDDWETPLALTQIESEHVLHALAVSNLRATVHVPVHVVAPSPSTDGSVGVVSLTRTYYATAEMNEGDEVGGASRDCEGRVAGQWGHATSFVHDRIAACGETQFMSEGEFCHVDGVFSYCPTWLCDLGWADCGE